MVRIIPTNLVCVLFGIAIPTSSFNFIQLFLYLFLLFFYCVSATIVSIIIEDGRCQCLRVCAKIVVTPLVNSPRR